MVILLIMNIAICSAIKAKRVITFHDDGDRRIVEPYCHGTSRAGYEVLRGYQTGGQSDSEPLPGWRLYLVSRMSNFEITQDTFPGTNADYQRNDEHIPTIHCQV